MTIEVSVGDRTKLDERAQADPFKPGMGTRVETIGLTVHQLDADLAGQLATRRRQKASWS